MYIAMNSEIMVIFKSHETIFILFQVKAMLLNLILKSKKGRNYTILCQDPGELRTWLPVVGKSLIWMN